MRNETYTAIAEAFAKRVKLASLTHEEVLYGLASEVGMVLAEELGEWFSVATFLELCGFDIYPSRV